MAGYRDIILNVPPILLANLKITSPAKTLSDCRILGNTDPVYGTVGWVPSQNANLNPFAIVKTHFGDATYPETNRLWMKYRQEVFIGIAHYDTPFVIENFNDEAAQWIEQMVQVVASNSRVLPVGSSVSPVAGDVWWEFSRADIVERHLVFGSWYYGVKVSTTMRVVYGVNYQP